MTVRRLVVVAVTVLCSAGLVGCGGGSDGPVTAAVSCGVSAPLGPANRFAGIAVSLQGRRCWDVPLPLLSNGEVAPPGPVEADGAVYFVTGYKVTALDIAGGKRRWTWAVRGPSGARALVQGAFPRPGRVLVVFVRGFSSPDSLVGLDERDGTVRWHRDLPTTIDVNSSDVNSSGQTGVEVSFTAGPSGYVPYPRRASVTTEMIDGSNGKVRWKQAISSTAPSPDTVTEAPARSLDDDGVSVYTALMLPARSGDLLGTELIAVDDRTGRQLWRAPGGNAPAPAMTKTAASDGVVLAPSRNPPTTTWGAADQSELSALDIRTGQPLWHYGPAPGEMQLDELNGVVIIDVNQVHTKGQGPGSTPGVVSGLDLRTGRVLWANGSYAGQLEVRPTKAGGVAIIKPLEPETPGEYTALAVADGRMLWHTDAPVEHDTVSGNDIAVIEGPNAAGPAALIGRSDTTGAVLWRTPIIQPVAPGFRPSPAAAGANDQLFADGPLLLINDTGLDGSLSTLTAYQATSGQLAWRINLPTGLTIYPTTNPNFVPVPGGLVLSTIPMVPGHG